MIHIKINFTIIIRYKNKIQACVFVRGVWDVKYDKFPLNNLKI